MQDRSTEILFEGEYSARFPICYGLSQAFPVSPFLFLLFLEHLLQDTRETWVMQTTVASCMFSVPGRFP